jgi:hypothetical protein
VPNFHSSFFILPSLASWDGNGRERMKIEEERKGEEWEKY